MEDSNKITTLDPINIYRHSEAKEYTFILNIHRTSVKTDHMLQHKINLKEFQRTKSYQCM